MWSPLESQQQFDLTQNCEDSKAQQEQIIVSNQQPRDLVSKIKKEKQKNGQKIKNRKIAKGFSIQEEKKILNLVLRFGPKFKKVTKAFNGKSLNVIKNHYYRNLRFRWHEILGMEYIHLNEKKEEVTFESLLTDAPLHTDLKLVFHQCLNGIQEMLQFLNRSPDQ